MRWKLGRPDIEAYRDRFVVPAAGAASPLSVTFLGVATLLLDDGQSALLTDGFFSRPGLLPVAAGRVAPDRSRVRESLARAGIDRLAAVVPVHTHFDHALDSPLVAELTGARLVGSSSAAQVGRGSGLAEDRIAVAQHGETREEGQYAITFLESEHCPPDRYPGRIEAPVRPPARVGAYRCGEAWALLVEHRPSGRTLLILGSAGFRPGLLASRRADVVYLGVGQLGLQPESYLRDYWTETVRAVGARRVVLIHWDDFFRPLDQPFRALPFAGDDLDATMRVLGRLADDDGVALWLPTVWAREDPWA
jgi:L-ascorbate metabolism protein UlaG (beta-lactamase superfamily)